MTTPCGTSIRRLIITTTLALFFQFMTPSPAHAWFGWLEEWSGPGPFWGELYEIRVACFGPPVKTPSTLFMLASKAIGKGEHLLTLMPTETFDSQALGRELQDVQQQWKGLIKEIHDTEVALNGVDNKTKDFASLFESPSTRTALRRELDDRKAKVAGALNSINRELATAIGAGVLVSLCGPEKARRLSLEVELDHWRTKHTKAEFAGGKPITMYTIMSSVTWNVFHDKPFDLLEIGLGGGIYFFRSEGFDTFSGGVIQPKLDLHAPTSWSTQPLNHPKRILSMFTLRGSVMWVPGFDANAFAGPGQTTQAISAEATPSIQLFFNLNSLLTRTLRMP